MNRRLIVGLIAAWIVSLVGVGLWAQQGDLRRVQTLTEGQPSGEIITGENIGFQHISGQAQPGKIVGRVMVRINGQWLEVQPYVGIVK